MVYFTFAVFQGEFHTSEWDSAIRGLSGVIAFLSFILGSFVHYQKDEL